MTILVTGANGQLGNELRIASSGSADRFVFTDVSDAAEEQIGSLRRLAGEGVRTDTVKLDITDAEAIRRAVREYDVRVIVNCAAFTDVEAAEDRKELAELLNAEAPRRLAEAMKEAGGLLVHISTDYVFGAEPYNTPCREDQKGTPTGVYGLTKLHGEQAIGASGCDHVIIRTAWLYSEFGKNFLRTMLGLTATRPQLKVVYDQAGTPTYALGLAKAILKVIGDYGAWTGRGEAYPRSGIYHYSDEGVCSWFDFARLIARCAGHSDCDIRPCRSDEFPSKVVRPSYSVLDKTKIAGTFGVEVPYWMSGVEKCVNFFNSINI